MLMEVRARNRALGHDSDQDSEEEDTGGIGESDPTLQASLLTTQEWARQAIPIKALQVRELQKTLKKQELILKIGKKLTLFSLTR